MQQAAGDKSSKEHTCGPAIEPTPWELPGRHVYDGRVYGAMSTKEHLDQIKTFQLYPEDVVLASPPKCGTVWLTEIVWLMKNNVDTEAAKSVPNKTRVRTIDVCLPGVSKVDELNQKPPGRVFATHLDSSFYAEQLQKVKPKVIVFLRNPKDRLVSFYHFHRANDLLGNYTGTFSDFLKMDFENELHHGDYISTALSWWKYRGEANFLFLTYEEMKEDAKSQVENIASFLGIDLSDEQLETIVQHTSFDNLKANPMALLGPAGKFNPQISSYIRKGIIGDWKNYFTVAENGIMDQILKDKLAGTGLQFTFE